MDDTDTINPAALNAPSSTIAPNLLTQPSPRGIKRSRSPDLYGGTLGQDGGFDDAKAKKRSRPGKTSGGAGDPAQTMAFAQSQQQPVQTPRLKTQALPQTSPNQSSPQKSTPGSATRSAVVKALPTVRDHTTDQLGPEGDEYIPREADPDGEAKVSKDGYVQDGRKYKCRTFQVPNRGEKLFMLATECARVLGYRDSYLLFNKNRSLFKIIANQQEKDNLIHQEILPYSYRSRQIAIVTARSMFRQFGSRLVEGGRRVRDDYWVAKAIKQGFTEEDAAGEKRPGAAKAREAAAAEAKPPVMTSLPQGEIIYSNGPGFIDGQPPMQPVSLAPLPMIHLPSDDMRAGGYGNLVRPRQEASGALYHDRTQSSGAQEILGQATHAAEFNKTLGQTRGHRAKYLDDYWRRPHEQPASQAEQGSNDMGTVAPQNLQSPQTMQGMNQGRSQQDQMSHPSSQMIPQAYAAYPNQQASLTSPVQSMHRSMPSGPLQQGSPMGMGSSAGHSQRTPSYTYGSSQLWQGQQAQPSPLTQPHALQYGQQQQQHASMPPPQMTQQQQPGMTFPQMNPIGNAAYGSMSRSMYQPSPSPSHFNMGGAQQAHPGQQQQHQQHHQQQSGMQGWSAPGSANSMPAQDWQRYQ